MEHTKFLRTKQRPALLPIAIISLLLFFAGPPKASAGILLPGCELFIGTSCNLGITTIFLDGTTTPFVDISTVITAVDDPDNETPQITGLGGAPAITPGTDYIYQYRAEKVYIGALTDLSFILTFPLSANITQFGFIDDSVSANPTTDDPFGNFTVEWINGISPGSPPSDPEPRSDLLYIRSNNSPGLIFLNMASGQDDGTNPPIFLQGSGVVYGAQGGAVAAVLTDPIPEPGTLLLLGSGLLGLVVARRRKTR